MSKMIIFLQGYLARVKDRMELYAVASGALVRSLSLNPDAQYIYFEREGREYCAKIELVDKDDE